MDIFTERERKACLRISIAFIFLEKKDITTCQQSN